LQAFICKEEEKREMRGKEKEEGRMNLVLTIDSKLLEEEMKLHESGNDEDEISKVRTFKSNSLIGEETGGRCESRFGVEDGVWVIDGYGGDIYMLREGEREDVNVTADSINNVFPLASDVK
jgi:hypothetical protein